MRPLTTIAAVLLICLGCSSRIFVEFPPEPQLVGLPSGPRVAMVYVEDRRDNPEMLKSGFFQDYHIRPVPAVLFTAALRTALEEEGCVVAQLAAPGKLGQDDLRRFLSDHGLDSLVRAEVVRFSLERADGFLGTDRVESSLKVTVLSAKSAGLAAEVITHAEERWGGPRALFRPDSVIADLAAVAVRETVHELLRRIPIRAAIGLTGKGVDIRRSGVRVPGEFQFVARTYLINPFRYILRVDS